MNSRAVGAAYCPSRRGVLSRGPTRRPSRRSDSLTATPASRVQSVRQVHIWLRDEGIELPVKSRDGEARGIVWRLPAYNIVHNILTNPIYAGAYAFGRTRAR
jgi:hypothetical protein